ncbi:hypothetical protein [Pontibacter sp. G13]|uniref:hypothetical protein n=1 Tax=Pontibacter sp. G13 TaxID=3074898 RepID=UPI00288A6AEB|nr:hypothetical protein [Pontibacter sp. G13]WNJ20047.1 hypothetical protein RJD25_06145 [Pontibacter sp. G13]
MHYFEIALILGVIAWQFSVFLKTNRVQIRDLRSLFPDRDYLKLLRFHSPTKKLQELTSDQIDGIIYNYDDRDVYWGMTPNEDEAHAGEEVVEIELIDARAHDNEVFKRIASATNVYLVRNKNHSTDFDIIRDITDRELEAHLNQIESSIQVPLYLGLIGTIAGIIFGLFGLVGGISDASNLDVVLDGIQNQIPQLMTGIAIAMFASGVGLVLTVVSSGYTYKKALKESDRNRNSYLTFLQTELLPELSSDMDSSLRTFKGLMDNFNFGLGQNLQHLGSTLDKVKENLESQMDTLREQQTFLESFEEIKGTVKEITSSNVKVYRAIEKSAGAFDRFAEYQNQLQTTGQSVQDAFQGMGSLFDRFQHFEGQTNRVADHVVKTLEEQSTMMAFLQKHLKEIEHREEIFSKHVNKLNDELKVHFTDLDDRYKRSVELLNEESHKSLSEYKMLVTRELDLLTKSYETHRPQWDELKHLSGISSNLEEIQDQIPQPGPAQLETNEALKSLNANMETLVELMKASQQQQAEAQQQQLEVQQQQIEAQNQAVSHGNGGLSPEERAFLQMRIRRSKAVEDFVGKLSPKRIWTNIRSRFSKKSTSN